MIQTSVLTEKKATSPISAITSKTCSPSRWTGVALGSGASARAVDEPTAIARSLLRKCNGRESDAEELPPPIREPGPNRWHLRPA